jgi:hypothetical protein
MRLRDRQLRHDHPDPTSTEQAMNKLFTALVVAAALTGCVTEPADQPTQPPPPAVVDNTQILQIVWAELTTIEQSDLCDGYRLLPVSVTFDAFNDGSGGAFTRTEFQTFFDKQCG